jgi:hypothetical protein
MSRSNERETLLKVATEDQWKRWIHGDNTVLGELPPIKIWIRSGGTCLFCRAYNGECNKCMSLEKEPVQGMCFIRHDGVKNTIRLRNAGKQRLKEAGILTCDEV